MWYSIAIKSVEHNSTSFNLPVLLRKLGQSLLCFPPSQFVVRVNSTIVLNVLTPTLVGPLLFVKYNTNDIWSC